MMTETTASELLELRMQVEIDATPEEVFDAYTDPRKQRLWLSALGPDDGAVETTVDLRPGGRWEARFRPNPETHVHDVQTYVEIDRPHRLVTDLVAASNIGGQEMPALETRIVLTFEPGGAGTVIAIEQSGFPTEQMRDFFRDVAWPGGFARLGDQLRTRRG